MRSFRGRFGTSRAFRTVPASLFAASPSLLRRRRPWSGGQRGCELNDAICSQSICFWEGGRSACGGVWLPPKLLLERPLVRGRRSHSGRPSCKATGVFLNICVLVEMTAVVSWYSKALSPSPCCVCKSGATLPWKHEGTRRSPRAAVPWRRQRSRDAPFMRPLSQVLKFLETGFDKWLHFLLNMGVWLL